MYPIKNEGDRFFFFPFLVGAVTGGAAVGLTRPRPIVNAYPNQQYYPPYPNYTNYSYTNYGGYPPYPYYR